MICGIKAEHGIIDQLHDLPIEFDLNKSTIITSCCLTLLIAIVFISQGLTGIQKCDQHTVGKAKRHYARAKICFFACVVLYVIKFFIDIDIASDVGKNLEKQIDLLQPLVHKNNEIREHPRIVLLYENGTAFDVPEKTACLISTTESSSIPNPQNNNKDSEVQILPYPYPDNADRKMPPKINITLNLPITKKLPPMPLIKRIEDQLQKQVNITHGPVHIKIRPLEMESNEKQEPNIAISLPPTTLPIIQKVEKQIEQELNVVITPVNVTIQHLPMEAEKNNENSSSIPTPAIHAVPVPEPMEVIANPNMNDSNVDYLEEPIDIDFDIEENVTMAQLAENISNVVRSHLRVRNNVTIHHEPNIALPLNESYHKPISLPAQLPQYNHTEYPFKRPFNNRSSPMRKYNSTQIVYKKYSTTQKEPIYYCEKENMLIVKVEMIKAHIKTVTVSLFVGLSILNLIVIACSCCCIMCCNSKYKQACESNYSH